MNPATIIPGEHIVQSVADALQFISHYHPADYIRHLAAAYRREQSPAAKDAIAQILINSRMSALGNRPVCQDTGTVIAFAKVGQDIRIDSSHSLAHLINEGVHRAWTDPENPLRASIVRDPLFDRRNTGDNTPAVFHTELVPGGKLEITLAAKGGGSENKARFAVLNPSQSLVDWVLATVPQLGAGWCPPGVIALGVGGSAEKAMLLAKEALLEEIDMSDLLARGPETPAEKLRVELYQKINSLGIGAQGLGGLTTVVDVKIATYPTHAASKPVALIPQCAANRHARIVLDGSGPVALTPPSLEDWPDIPFDPGASARRVDLDTLTKSEMAAWHSGERLLLSGRLLTARDAAHQRIKEMLARGESLPFSLQGRTIYYVGPVDAAKGEVVGPAGPTTATRMDSYLEMTHSLGIVCTIGKAERGPAAVESIRKHGTTYLIGVGGAAYLISKSIRAARIVAFSDLGMEAIRELEVEDMPVTVAVDAAGNSIHQTGPAQWAQIHL
jgi:fumarate hydratase class I